MSPFFFPFSFLFNLSAGKDNNFLRGGDGGFQESPVGQALRVCLSGMSVCYVCPFSVHPIIGLGRSLQMRCPQKKIVHDIFSIMIDWERSIRIVWSTFCFLGWGLTPDSSDGRALTNMQLDVWVRVSTQALGGVVLGLTQPAQPLSPVN